MHIHTADGEQPHSDYTGWQDFIDQCCELRGQADGVLYYGTSNCNFIVFPTGELVANYGYHGAALLDRVRADGWQSELARLHDARRNIEQLLNK